MLAMPTAVNQMTAVRQSYQLVTFSSHKPYRAARGRFATQRAAPVPVKLPSRSVLEEAEGPTPGSSA